MTYFKDNAYKLKVLQTTSKALVDRCLSFSLAVLNGSDEILVWLITLVCLHTGAEQGFHLFKSCYSFPKQCERQYDIQHRNSFAKTSQILPSSAIFVCRSEEGLQEKRSVPV